MTTQDWKEDLRQHVFIINPIKYPDFKGEDGLIHASYVEFFIESLLKDTERNVLERVREWAKEKAYDISIKTVENPHWIVDLDDVLLFLSSLTNDSSKE